MTNPSDPTPPPNSGEGFPLEADPRNPLDITLMGGIHAGKSMRLVPPIPNALLLPTNTDNQPSAPFFAEYRPTDRRHPLNGLRIWEFVGIGIDQASMADPLANLPARKAPTNPFLPPYPSI